MIEFYLVMEVYVRLNFGQICLLMLDSLVKYRKEKLAI